MEDIVARSRSRVNRPSAILNDPAVREYFALLRIAHSQIADDHAVADKDRCARAMVDAYYKGQLDRERIAREIDAVYA